MKSAIIFDVDGTLVDTVDLNARAWQEAFRHFKHQVPLDAIREQIGKGGDQLLPVFLSKKEVGQTGKEIERYRADLYKRKYLPQARAFPRVRELFQKIREAGQSIALASSCKKDELAFYKRLANIEDLLSAEASADDADKSKPHPDIFEAAITKLGKLTVAEAIAVGDTPYDAEAAGKIGLQTIGLLSGGFLEEQLKAAGCIAIYQDPADFLAHYDESPARGK